MNALVYSSSLVAAFLGGVLALFAPCCIVTLLPNFVGASLQRGIRALPVTAGLFSAGLGVVLLPIVLGVGSLSHAIGTFHGPVFITVGVILVVLGVRLLTGRGWALPIPMPRGRVDGSGAGSVVLLGVLSGVASSCCAPVMAGVIAMSALSASVVGALGLGLAYVFGMVFPLLLFALAAAGGSARGRGPRRVRMLSVAGRPLPWTDVASGAMFVVVGLITFLLGVSGRESYTPGPLANWDTWITGRFADLAAFLGRAPGVVQAAMLVALALVVCIPLVRAARHRDVVPAVAATDDAVGGIDPVCGMTVHWPAATVQWGGVLYVFCARACAQRFELDPAEFVGGGLVADRVTP